ncbi:uncharacterized protein BHQ10_009686 [Talaromyces amestolkiae]|uniref:Uncharacterized protein n=1 Tax=Talaromyces amestolkiae TaxID=1196081 RepID=A0A364LCX8_TALAM|nr:uncharacterized protein BHQ10_009686 [Talaromyces amestolkiae]RAO73674.1 hypothetical protein BHQ10_009686 [Talaromyces amestolkiae]
MSPQYSELMERFMPLDYAATDTNEELVKTIINHKYTQDEFQGVVDEKRRLIIERLLDHFCAIQGIDTEFYLSTPKETCSVKFRDDERTFVIQNLPDYEDPRLIAEEICEHRITRRETKGLFSKLRQTVVENEIQKLAEKKGFDISFFDLEETDFYDDEPDSDTVQKDCPTTPGAPDSHSPPQPPSTVNEGQLPPVLIKRRIDSLEDTASSAPPHSPSIPQTPPINLTSSQPLHLPPPTTHLKSPELQHSLITTSREEAHRHNLLTDPQQKQHESQTTTRPHFTETATEEAPKLQATKATVTETPATTALKVTKAEVMASTTTPTLDELDKMSQAALEQLQEIKDLQNLGDPWKTTAMKAAKTGLSALLYRLQNEGHDQAHETIKGIEKKITFKASEIPDGLKDYRVKYAYSKYEPKALTWREYIRIKVATYHAEEYLGIPHKPARATRKRTISKDLDTKTTSKDIDTKAATEDRVTKDIIKTEEDRAPSTLDSRSVVLKRNHLNQEEDRASITSGHKRQKSITLDETQTELVFRIKGPYWLADGQLHGYTIYSVDFFRQGTVVAYLKRGYELIWQRVDPGEDGTYNIGRKVAHSYSKHGDSFSEHVTAENSWVDGVPDKIRKTGLEARFFRHDDRGFLIFYRKGNEFTWGYRTPSSQPHGHFEIIGDEVSPLNNIDSFYDEKWIADNIEQPTYTQDEAEEVDMLWSNA